jgi:IS30 family transposase
MAHCSQLSINEREKISLGLAKGFSKNYIALSLGRLSSTICREVNRNTANGQVYRVVKAQHRANKLTWTYQPLEKTIHKWRTKW